MKKLILVGAILLVTAVSVIILTAVIPTISSISTTTAATLSASSNMTNYPGTLGFIAWWPQLVYFVPFIIGGVLIVLVLKSP